MSSQYLSLSRHPKQYSFSFGDAGFTLLTGFSGVTYARRHWDMSRSERVWGHRTIALLEFIPVIGGVAALVERIAVYISHYFQGAVRFTSQIPAEDLAAFCSRCSTRDLLDFSRANRRVRVIALRELESRFMLDLPTHIPEQRLGAELKDTIEKLRLHFQPDDANPVNNQFPGLTQLLGYIPKWVPPEPNHYSLYNVFQLRSRELLQHLLAKEPPIRYHLVLCRDLLLNQQFRMADYVICYVSSVCSKEEILKSLISSALRSGNMTIVEKLEDAAGRDIVQICYISEQCNIISEADESNNEAIQQHVITIFKELGRRLQLNPDLIPIIDRLKSENFRKIILESALQLDCDPAKALKAAYSTNNVSYIERWRNKFELQNNFHPMELS
ncbi:MAG TPA: hypothetical protein VMR37_06365, partial [Rhabdochlamydiaceae bacterium]|nr:hypothetical protein [Rhabdochlamydiaceae bacterium]